MPSLAPLILSYLRGAFPLAIFSRPGGAVGNEKRGPGLPGRDRSPLLECLEVMAVLAALTVAGWFTPFSYHALGHVYLLAVIMLCLRVSRWPALAAAVVSGLAWNFVFMPPRLSFSVLDFDDGLLLGSYFVVALVAGLITARIREQERSERRSNQRATALFHLTRALTGARTLDDAVAAALRQADELFGARTALLLANGKHALAKHPASSCALDEKELKVAEWCRRNNHEAGRFTRVSPEAAALHLPLHRPGVVLGVFVLAPPASPTVLSAEQRELIDAFAAQIALLVEREQLRDASEREKLLAESDRLHRTLLDSVSHELRTPLSVLRSAAENLPRADASDRGNLAGEILAATSRLDRVVANLLNQTRLESGAIQVQLDWCDVRDLVGAARRSLSDTLAGRPVKITIPADLPLFMADAPLMEQVVTNLLHNAAQHTPPGTPVLVTAGIDEAQSRVFITISDQGPGLEPGVRESLFGKFRRGRQVKSTGLGLGLSIVHGLMLAQGGSVEAGYPHGPGATFSVYLPHALHANVPHE